MITNAEFINQPYAGIDEEKIFDAESVNNSQEWSWVRFTNDDETEWCGQFRGFPIQAAVSETYCTILILTSNHLFQLNTIDGQLITSIENIEFRNLTVGPSGDFIISDSNTIFRIENNIQLIIPLKSPFRMDLIKFKNWDVGNLLFECEEFCNWGVTHRMKLNDELKNIEYE